MSRSVHQTVKSVFGGKSKAEIARMIEGNDPDVVAIIRKHHFKREASDSRDIAAFFEKLAKQVEQIEENGSDA